MVWALLFYLHIGGLAPGQQVAEDSGRPKPTAIEPLTFAVKLPSSQVFVQVRAGNLNGEVAGPVVCRLHTRPVRQILHSTCAEGSEINAQLPCQDWRHGRRLRWFLGAQLGLGSLALNSLRGSLARNASHF